MIKVIGMRCGLTKFWVQHHPTFHAVHSDRPSRDGLSASDSVASIVRAVVRVADPAAKLKELLPELAAAEGIADLEETIAKVIDKAPSARRVESVPPDITLSQAGAKFFARNVPSKEKPTTQGIERAVPQRQKWAL